ncbi:unnamed protein product [Staurois parvus]|uniref:Uncharacterized protein n=1 Tax=Staurois parvus TaxID=386267 RepID=A0ABN9DKG5_9NEOB|nr:unnamed protein product [Staurois parvus]
MPFYSSTPS